MFRALAIIAAVVAAAHAAPIDGVFSYQGRLTNSGAPVTGTADFKFRLYDAEVLGGQVGGELVFFAETVSDGLFNVELNFGVGVFDGSERWLEIEARSPAGVGGYTLLGPRQHVLRTPYSIQTRGLFVDANLMVGVNTTTPGARLHVGGGSPSLLVADGGNASILFDGTTGNPQRILARHSTDNGFVAGMQEGPWGGQWQSYDREGDGFGGLIATMGSSGSGGDGILHLYSKETGSLNVMLRADLNNNNDDNETGYLQLGSSGANGIGGTLVLHDNDGNPTVNLLGGPTGAGGSLGTFDPFTSAMQFLVEPDTSPGGGGRLHVTSNDGGLPGLVVDGNFSGTESVNVFMFGNAGSASFLTDLAADGSVNLPSDSISALETRDEAGVASANEAGGVTLTEDPETLISRTVTVPTDGYCLVIGRYNALNIAVDAPLSTVITAAVAIDPAAYPLSGRTEKLIINREPFESFLMEDIDVFTVAAGTHTFYLLGEKQSDSWNALRPEIYVMFFPTAYGVVDAPARAEGGFDRTAQRTHVYGPVEVAAEQFEAAAFEQQRRDAELRSVRSQLELALQRLENLEAERGDQKLPITAPRDVAGALPPPERRAESAGMN